MKERDKLYRDMANKGRFRDKQFTKELNRFQDSVGVKYNSKERSEMRDIWYKGLDVKEGSHLLRGLGIDKGLEKEIDVYNNLNNNVLKEQVHNSKEVNVGDKWLQWYRDKHGGKSQLTLITYNQELHQKINFDYKNLIGYLKENYGNQINYGYLAIIFEGNLNDIEGIDVSWSTISKVTITLEHLKDYNGIYKSFKKDKKVKQLKDFREGKRLNENNVDETTFGSIEYGYEFKDLLISENTDTKILIMQKIELDDTPVPCPICLTSKQKSNSYKTVFKKSYECSNPYCSGGSKSGRGKRFSEYSVYREMSMVPANKITSEMYKAWQRDVFKDGLDYIEMLIKYYSWVGDNITIVNRSIGDGYGRQLVSKDLEYGLKGKGVESTNFYKLLESYKHNDESKPEINLNNRIEVIEGDSLEIMRGLRKDDVGYGITSPPYYNVREYSQWETLYTYFIDMYLNIQALYTIMQEQGVYLYNIGDIVSQDNIYVESLQSNRRQMLGFYSMLVGEMAGFKVEDNIIWDKGSVQSKRNSTVNLYPGYVKQINCYEHIIVFRKGRQSEPQNKVFKNSAVIKIGRGGENRLGHTAPYPLELVENIRGFIENDKYIIDPFLGSGTTLIWCRDNGYKGVGIERDRNYYELAKERLREIDMYE